MKKISRILTTGSTGMVGKNLIKYLLDNVAAEQVNVKWGKGRRNVIIIGGKKYQYKGVMILIRN